MGRHLGHPDPGRQLGPGEGFAGQLVCFLEHQHNIQQRLGVGQPPEAADQMPGDLGLAEERHQDRYLGQAIAGFERHAVRARRRQVPMAEQMCNEGAKFQRGEHQQRRGGQQAQRRDAPERRGDQHGGEADQQGGQGDTAPALPGSATEPCRHPGTGGDGQRLAELPGDGAGDLGVAGQRRQHDAKTVAKLGFQRREIVGARGGDQGHLANLHPGDRAVFQPELVGAGFAKRRIRRLGDEIGALQPVLAGQRFLDVVAGGPAFGDQDLADRGAQAQLHLERLHQLVRRDDAAVDEVAAQRLARLAREWRRGDILQQPQG